MGSRTFTLVVVHVHGLHDALAIDAVILLLATHVLVIALPRTAIERQHGAAPEEESSSQAAIKSRERLLATLVLRRRAETDRDLRKFFVKALS